MNDDMIHDELRKLAGMRAPASSEAAKDRALMAAMDAFDDAHAEKTSTETQGLGEGARPISIINRFWSSIMTSIASPILTMKPATMAAATAVMLVPFGGYVALNVWPDTQPAELAVERANGTSQEAKSPAKVVKRNLTTPSRQLQQRREQAASQGEALADLAAGQSTALSAPASKRKRVARSFAKRESAPFSELRTTAQPSLSPVRMPNVASEKYPDFESNGVKSVADQPVSTFSIDVDTASYSRVRRALMAGHLPSKDMVRVEELVNYFNYDYAVPANRSEPFKPTVSVMPTPWNAHTQLLHIGIKGFDIEPVEQPRANLVFLLDVSGSMNAADKLPLLVKSFQLLLQKLRPDDTVSIVTYAGRAGTVLKPTKASNKAAIFEALNNLRAGGSTAGAQGIEQAYRLAEQSFVKGGVNRVMLATDGDFNVGLSDPNQLKDFIAQKRKTGVFLSVFGFGQGNINDALMQSLAQNGNGTAAYIDTLAEAQKALVEEAGSMLFPIAKDVKIQMEFNPARIAEYRLIGYETRALKREDFNNDKVDAGDIGAGHSVTAVYEITPVGSPAILNTQLRYGDSSKSENVSASDELGFLKMRYKLPNESTSKLIETPIGSNATIGDFNEANVDARFSVAVATFAQKLRRNEHVDDISYAQIAKMATAARGEDRFGYRSAFVQLVRMAGSLSSASSVNGVTSKND